MGREDNHFQVENDLPIDNLLDFSYYHGVSHHENLAYGFDNNINGRVFPHGVRRRVYGASEDPDRPFSSGTDS